MADWWRYYNHALLPTTLPLDEVDTSDIENGTIWNTDEGKKALFARWTTDFDCGHETNWWYWIADKAIDLEKTSAKKRYEIKKGLKNCTVERISPTDYAEELYGVYLSAVTKYKKFTNFQTKEDYVSSIFAQSETNVEYWGIFGKQTGRQKTLVGYGLCVPYREYVSISVLKYVPEFLKLNSAYAITYTILNEYITNRGYKFVTNGERTIRHDTQVSEFNRMHFDFRKAYCKLNIAYRPGFDRVVKMLYPFRKLLKPLSFIGQINNVCSLLLLEQLRRENLCAGKKAQEVM